MTRTSHYVRHSLQEHVLVWIAQRQGRAKDGFDRTDPALIKMLALAYRKQAEPISELLNNGALVPVSLSYEVDPCAPAKAKELAALARDGEYAKGEEEDLDSMIQGLLGYKGRVHVHFSKPIAQDCDSVDQLVQQLDSAIVGGIRVFSTNRYADAVLADEAHGTREFESYERVTNPVGSMFRRTAFFAAAIRQHLRESTAVWITR